MPIRFRCAYCNQLLGIARRKAGQVVRCPTCAGQVVVPSPDEVPDEENVEAGAPSVPSPPVFERSDFDEVFHAPAPAPPAPPLPITEGPGHGSAGYDVEPFDPGPPPPPVAAPAPAAAGAAAGAAAALPPPVFEPPPGLVLSPAKATVLTVVWIVSVAVAFGVGLLVGLSLK